MTYRSSTPAVFFIIAACLFTVTQTANILSKQFIFETSPLITTDSNTPQNKSICFADCRSCQAKTGDCEKCFSPWYELREGKCSLAFPEYKLQSTEEEQRFQNFIPSSEWSFQGQPVTNKTCVPNQQFFRRNFTMIGPFSTGEVKYQRTVSQHNYWGIKFLLILSNWTQSSSLRIKVTNEGGSVIEEKILSTNISQIKQAYQEPICSNSSSVDRRVSVSLQVRQEQSSQLSLSFFGNMGQGATWGLSSFVLITGKCNSKCALCDKYTPNADGCLICNNFLANNQATGEKCSTCLEGFYFLPTQTACQKCPIQTKQCKANNTVCHYSNITNSSDKCAFNNSIFFDNKELVEDTFFGSLFTIQNKGAVVTRCGAYSVVGPANFGDIITRSFVQLKPHIKISINFNIFIFQQKQTIQRYTIAIFLNGQPLQLGAGEQTINITGTSSECDLDTNSRSYEAMKTFETQTFTTHKKMQNVVVGISLGTSTINSETRWGIRDIRLVFKRCDDNCQDCTENGCQRCKGFLQLTDMQCTDCLLGTGFNASAKACEPCPNFCVTCNSKNKVLVCSKCLAGYFLYAFNGKTTCQRNPIYGPVVEGNMPSTQNCSVKIPNSKVNSPQNLEFKTLQNRGIMVFSKVGTSVRKNIQFYLMKIDDWEGDYLDIYANDLLLRRIQFGSAGSFYCGEANQGDEISLQQFEIEDDNTTVRLEFEAVHKDITKTRKFAISNLNLSSVGCLHCVNYNFQYQVKYNYDQRLFAEVAFNLVPISLSDSQFKNVFKLKAGNRQLKYEVSRNDSFKYWLKSQPLGQSEIFQKNLTLECVYPEKVTARIPFTTSSNPYNFNAFQFFNRRVLQQQKDYETTKIIDNTIASTFVDRYSSLGGREESVLGLQTFFSLLTRIVVYLGFASFFFGCQTSCTHVMHNFQKIWVHIYVASLALSPIFKTALWGFRECQDQNIAVLPDNWEAALPKYLYYDAPAQYQHYFKDITFFRHIYNVGVAFAILTLIYVIFYCLFSKIQTKNNNLFFRHFRVVFKYRPIFFFNSLIFYQYFTVCLACCLQFLDLKTHTNQPTFAGINAAACIIAFIFATLYPIIFHFLIQHKRRNIQELMQTIMGNNRNKDFGTHQRDLLLLEDHHLQFTNKYGEIFYRFLPKSVYNENLADAEMITQRHIFYNLFRYGDLWWHAIVVILLYYSPFAQAFLLILINGFHLALNVFAPLNTNKIFRVLKSLELLFFIVVEIMIIVMLTLLKTLRFQSFETVGIVAIIFVFFIITVTLCRFFYCLYRLYKEYRRTDQDLRGVIRTDEGFKLV